MGQYFEDFQVGTETITPARTITEADVVAFAGLSGDYNPLHTDAVFAQSTPFGARVAHGVLGLSIATGLISRTGQLDGTALAFLGIDEWKFLLPIKLGDTIRVRMEVIGTRPTSKATAGVLRRKVELLNQRDEVVQGGSFAMLVRRRPEPR